MSLVLSEEAPQMQQSALYHLYQDGTSFKKRLAQIQHSELYHLYQDVTSFM